MLTVCVNQTEGARWKEQWTGRRRRPQSEGAATKARVGRPAVAEVPVTEKYRPTAAGDGGDLMPWLVWRIPCPV